MEPHINWRQELLVIGFFVPIEQAATQFFQDALQSKEIVIKITHKLNLQNGGLELKIQLTRTKGNRNLITVDVPLAEQQIVATMQQQGANFTNIIGGFLAEISQKMLFALMPISFKEWMRLDDKCIEFARYLGVPNPEEEFINYLKEPIKQKEDAATFDQTTALGEDRQNGKQEA